MCIQKTYVGIEEEKKRRGQERGGEERGVGERIGEEREDGRERPLSFA